MPILMLMLKIWANTFSSCYQINSSSINLSSCHITICMHRSAVSRQALIAALLAAYNEQQKSAVHVSIDSNSRAGPCPRRCAAEQWQGHCRQGPEQHSSSRLLSCPDSEEPPGDAILSATCQAACRHIHPT